MKNEMESLRRQVEDLKTEVIRLQQELNASRQRSAIFPEKDTHLDSETAFREREDHLRRLVERAPIGIFTTSSSEYPHAINLAMAKILDFCSPEEALERYTDLSPQLYVHAERRNEFLRLLRDFGRVEDFEYQARTATGRIIWLNVHARVSERREDGSFIIEGFATDITERKRAEESLRESEEKFRLITETIDEVFWMADVEIERTFYVSPSFERIWGRSRESLYENSRSFIDAVHVEDREHVQAGFEIKKTGQPFEQKYRIVLPDGSIRHIWDRSFPIRDEKGQVRCYTGVATDITELKQAEDALRDSEERHRKIIEASSDAMILRSGGIIIYANRAALKLFRANHPGDLIGKRYIDLVHPDDRALSAERVKKTTDENWIAPPREHRILALDGQVVHVESTGVPVKYHGGLQIFGVFRDITERKRTDHEKEELEVQLRQAQKMEAIGSLAGGIAHDFNNILSVIIGNTELLGMTDISLSRRNELTQILNASQRAKQLVRQILAFSRQGEQQKLLISLNRVVKETLDFLRASLPSTIQLQHYINPDEGAILADPTQMQQVLMNLCTNAAHAMEKDGGVLKIVLDTITVAEWDEQIEPDVERGEYLRLTVSDTGHGIEPALMPRIFDPYFTTKGPDKGTGMGLSVVHGIVKSHGGTIKVYSEVGKGTVFHVFFPRADGAVKKEEKSVQQLPFGTERILVVDDEKHLVEMYQRMLSMLGYQVETRTSPVEAIEAVRGNPQKYDLVITDMTMPQMTGYNLAKQLMEMRPSLPIILCTGFSDQINEEKARSVGILAFLLKPLLFHDLANTLRMVLDETHKKKVS